MKTLLTQSDIQTKIDQLVNQLALKHHQDPTPIVFVCILNGGFMFFSDLVKSLYIPKFECDFLRIKSYNGKEQGDMLIVKNIETSIEDKHVYLVDDIFDSGNTIKYITKILKKNNPKSINTITLLKRKENLDTPENFYSLFELDQEWVWGYGMDDENGYNRNLPYIVGK
jgi:hypoxanthine phosphoribosyltransferase